MLRLGDIKLLLENEIFAQVKFVIDGEDHWINTIPGDERVDTLALKEYRFDALIEPRNPWQMGDGPDINELNTLENLVDFWIEKRDMDLDTPLGPNVTKEYNMWAKYYKSPVRKRAKIKVKGMSFYSIVPKDRLPYSEAEAMKIKDFCEYFFEKKFRKFIEKCWWVVESGKFKEQPNLHIHALISFKPQGAKNFRRELVTSWNKFWSDSKYTIDWKNHKGCGIHRVPCNTAQIQEDKIKYMENDHKGSHENFTDLGICGKF